MITNIIHDISSWAPWKSLTIAQDSSILLYGSQVQAGTIRIDVSAHTTADIVCIIYGSMVDNTCALQINLSCDQSSAHVYILTLAWEASTNDVQWTIYIAPQTKWCSGHLLQDNVLLGTNIKIKSIPQLDVHSHDVSASHGARFESFDANKIFYMSAKWLDPQTARQLLVQWYVQAALDKVITDGTQKNQIRDTILQATLAS